MNAAAAQRLVAWVRAADSAPTADATFDRAFRRAVDCERLVIELVAATTTTADAVARVRVAIRQRSFRLGNGALGSLTTVLDGVRAGTLIDDATMATVLARTISAAIDAVDLSAEPIMERSRAVPAAAPAAAATTPVLPKKRQRNGVGAVVPSSSSSSSSSSAAAAAAAAPASPPVRRRDGAADRAVASLTRRRHTTQVPCPRGTAVRLSVRGSPERQRQLADAFRAAARDCQFAQRRVKSSLNPLERLHAVRWMARARLGVLALAYEREAGAGSFARTMGTESASSSPSDADGGPVELHWGRAMEAAPELYACIMHHLIELGSGQNDMQIIRSPAFLTEVVPRARVHWTRLAAEASVVVPAGIVTITADALARRPVDAIVVRGAAAAAAAAAAK